MKFKLLLLFAIVGIIASCSKGDETAPIVTITSPASNITISQSDSLLVTGTVSDETALSKITVGDQVITTFDSPTAHAFNYIFTFSGVGTSIITVQATDKEGNVGSAQRIITVQ